MMPAPVPIRRRTSPPHFSHVLRGSSFIDWNFSKRWPHLRHSYSYVGTDGSPIRSDYVEGTAARAFPILLRATVRSSALAAMESRMHLSSPNSEPGTTATPASSRRYSASDIESEMRRPFKVRP